MDGSLGARPYVDSASFYELAYHFRLGRSSPDRHPWIGQCAETITALLMKDRSAPVVVSPAPARSAGTDDKSDYGVLFTLLTDERAKQLVDTGDEAPADSRQWALRQTQAWADRNMALLVSDLADLFSFQGNRGGPFASWLHLSQERAWLEHTTRLHGLFNAEFLPELARALSEPAFGYVGEVSEAQLQRLHALSMDETTVRRWMRQRRDYEDLRIVQAAYVTSALLRGPYHEFSAQHVLRGDDLHGEQTTHHPLRERVLAPKLVPGEEVVFKVASAEDYFVRILVNGALEEVGYAARAHLWHENVEKAWGSNALAELRKPEAEADPLGSAVTRARKLEIRVHPRLIDMIGSVASAAAGGLIGFALSPWIPPWASIPGGMTLAGARSLPLSAGLAGRLLDSPKHLGRLAQGGSGRLTPQWRPLQGATAPTPDAFQSSE